VLKLKPIALALSCALLTASCATLNDPGEKPYRVEPVSRVAGAGPAANYQLGRYYQGQVRYDKAIAAYRQALEENPALSDAHNNLGVVFAEQQLYEKAIEEFKAGIAHSPRAAHLHNNLGYAYVFVGRNKEALTSLEEAQRLDPADKRIAANLRLVRERLGIGESATSVTQTHEATAFEEDGTKSKLVQIHPGVYELRPKNPELVSVATASLQPNVVEPLRGLEVSNGNGVTGMAKKVARFLKRHGVMATRLTNSRPFTQRSTQIEYRHGFMQQANSINSQLPRPVLLVRTKQLREGVNVRLVLGKDLTQEAFENQSGPDSPSRSRVAANDPGAASGPN
jgi:hypothetical protein